MQNFKDIENLSIKLNDTCNAAGITRVLEETFSAVNIYIYDFTSETLRDFSKSWISIDEFGNKEKAKKLYKIFDELKNNNYIGVYINLKILVNIMHSIKDKNS